MNIQPGLTADALLLRADSVREDDTPEGHACTAYFRHAWDQISDDAVMRGRSFWECTSTMIGVVAWDDDVPTVYSRDDAVTEFGLPWVLAMEREDAEAAEC